MTDKKSNVEFVFPEFPDWDKLSKKSKDSVYEEMCDLWQSAEYDKVKQIFSYLFDCGYDEQKMDDFAEKADGDFQLFYAKKFSNLLENCDLAKARYWLKKAAANESCDAMELLEYGGIDDTVVGEIRCRLEELNKEITDAFYKKSSGIFFGEESAVLNEQGHIEFVNKEICRWNFMSGAEGLILAKDEPVKRSSFKMTGFSPELKAEMKKLAADESKFNCYPNIITYCPDSLFSEETDDFSKECDTWKILLQLLSHGYSLVDKYEYTMMNSEMLPPAVNEQIENHRKRAIKSLIDDDDDDDDDEIDFDDLDFDLDFEDEEE